MTVGPQIERRRLPSFSPAAFSASLSSAKPVNSYWSPVSLRGGGGNNSPRGLLTVGSDGPSRIEAVPQPTNLEEKLFETLVSLKVSVSVYAMHLPSEARAAIFVSLDEMLSFEDWHSEDRVPIIESFLSFLKWTIFTKHYDFLTLGLSPEGTILAAYESPGTMLTANFLAGEKVRWATKVKGEPGAPPEIAAGASSLKHFAVIAKFYLDMKVPDGSN